MLLFKFLLPFIKKYKYSLFFYFLFCFLMFDMISSVVSNLILKDFIDNIRNYDAKLLFIELALYAFIMSSSPLHKLLTYFLSFNFKTKAKEDIKMLCLKKLY